MSLYNPSARGSDTPRSFRQYVSRKFAQLTVAAMGLNRDKFLSTEIVQQIKPVCKIKTSFGHLLCRGGHGRLRWRAKTFYTEEPLTIDWLETISSDDYLWDAGANVGLYSMYPALRTGCRVLSIEPEAQNFALLVENTILNGLQDHIEVMNSPLTSKKDIGRFYVHDLTKGGAHNQFIEGNSNGNKLREATAVQVLFGVSMNELVEEYGFDFPTHIKIDVDGNEPDIIDGAGKVLSNSRCCHLLVEVETNNHRHQEMVEKIKGYDFKLVSQRSNWDSRNNRDLEDEFPMLNMIFKKQ